MKIAIISHTEHYISNEGIVVGWGSTVKEINNLLNIADEIYHLAPLHKEIAPKSCLAYKSKKISFIPLKPSGGRGVKKFSILLTAPYNLFKIYNHVKQVDFIQFRAPTGMGLYVLPFLRLFFNKKYWVKYAGNWKDPYMPLGNKIQKLWLQKLTSSNTKITVNGSWLGERNNIIPFENPCLNEHDRKLGIEIIKNKKNKEKLNFCFVGALNTHKGVDKIITAFINIKDKRIGRLDLVGDGQERRKYEEQSQKINFPVIFHGFLPKDEIVEIYKKSNFILLPSKSEGFPKVIGEAMNFGCIPIVSNVSCISDYIKDLENGLLIEPLNTEILINKILLSLNLVEENYEKTLSFNFNLAKKFTYSYYNNRIKNEVFK